MPQIEFQDGVIQIDAEIISRGLGLEAPLVQRLMRDGELTSLCERGQDEDAGRHRLTFFHRGRRLRLVVDANGTIVQSSTINFGDRSLPSSMHKAGA